MLKYDLPTTPFPLCVKEKYKHNKTEIILDAIDGSDLNTITAYRNAYRAKIKKKLDKCNSIFESPNELAGGCIENKNLVEIKWSRRIKPQWLEI